MWFRPGSLVLSLALLAGCSEPERREQAPPPAPTAAAAPQTETDAVALKGSKTRGAPAAKRPPAKPKDADKVAALEARARSSEGTGTYQPPRPPRAAAGAETVEAAAEPAPAREGTPGSIEWMSDLDPAIGRAREEHKLVFLFFTGSDWCGWCKKMKALFLETPEFKSFASTNLVLVEADFPKRKVLDPVLKAKYDALAARFGVASYPTVILLAPGDGTGKEILRDSGYDPDWGNDKYLLRYKRRVDDNRP